MRVSFHEDFFGRGGDMNTNLFSSTECGEQTGSIFGVLGEGNGEYPGAGWMQMLLHGGIDAGSCGGSKAHQALMLTSPETAAVKSPQMIARVMFRSDTPVAQTSLDHQEVLIGFTTVGQTGFVADDIIGFRALSDTTVDNWKAVHKVDGGTPVLTTLDYKPEYDVPRVFSVTLGQKAAIYTIDGTVVAEMRLDGPTNDLNFEVINAINNSPTANIYREVLVDFVSGSLER